MRLSSTFGSLVLPQILLLVGLQYVHSANILVFGAIGSHSTRISMFPFMEALSEKGHQVTFLSAFDNFEDPNQKSKITYYTPEKLKQSMGPWEDHIRFFDVRKQSLMFAAWLGYHDMGVAACQTLYSDPDYVAWIKNSKFDLIIMESVLNECALGLVHYHGTKLVVYGTTTSLPWFPDSYGLPDESSSLTDVIWDFPPGERMGFWQRIKNAITPIIFNFKRDYDYFPKLEEITRKGLGLKEGELPSFREMERNTSLILLTTHFTLDLPRSFPPHVVPIGGAVVGGKTPKPLNQKMEEFINSADKGFVYISFGTVAEFTNFDRDVQLEFISALKSFPDIKFLWKASIQINDTLPSNVALTKWAPQQTVLGHPKIKAFITHCGMGSTTEAVHFGVPLVLLPVLGEQDVNANAMEAKGAGIKLEITTLKKHELEEALHQILHNEKYRNTMKDLSKAFRDRPSQPIESAVWWIEYVMRHENSNDYLVPLSVRQPWWKRRQIDIWLTLAAVTIFIPLISLAIVIRLLKAVVKTVFGKKTSTPKLKKN